MAQDNVVGRWVKRVLFLSALALWGAEEPNCSKVSRFQPPVAMEFACARIGNLMS